MARSFASGSTQYLQASQHLPQTEGVAALTIVTWIKRTASNQIGPIIGNRGDVNSHSTIAAFWSDAKCYCDVSNGSGAYGAFNHSSTAWQHFAMVYDGAASGNSNRLKAYIDGASQSLTFTGTIPSTTSSNAGLVNWTLGRDLQGTGATQYTNGSMSESAVYSAALTVDEIGMLAGGYSPMSVRPAALISYWPLFGRGGASAGEEDWVGTSPLAHTNSPALAEHSKAIYPTRPIYIIPVGAAGALSIDAAPGSIAISGTAAGLLADRSTNALPGSFAITGIDAGTIYTQTRAVDAQPGALALSGIAAGLYAERATNAQPGSFAISGAAGTLVVGRMLDAAIGSITINGVAATLAIPGAQSIDALPGSFGITGTAASLIAGRSINAAAGSFAESGIAATFAREKALSADVGSYVVNGIDATLVAPLARELNAIPGSFAISGYAAGLMLPSTVPSFLGHIHVLSEEYRSHVLRRK
jgi:hypothetical protein